MQKNLFSIVIVLLLAVVTGMGSLFVVDERQTAFILQFGKVKRIIQSPGLKLKIPLIQEVVFYDRRLLDYNLPAIEVTAGDQKRMVIDVFARYVISDPLVFYTTVRTIDGANNRLSSVVPGSMRRVVGRLPLSKLLSKERTEIMENIHTEVAEAAKDFGITVKDVRIIRADLPRENSESIFRRMETERQREAKLFRAEGQKRANEIRAKAERKVREIIAEANKKSEITRGEGDAEVTRIMAQAYGRDPSFSDFYLSMQSYKVAFSGKNTSFVLSNDGKGFLKHF
ncbi:MAG: protease modulator HflC [Alphaproteobacteria bacterium]